MIGKLIICTVKELDDTAAHKKYLITRSNPANAHYTMESRLAPSKKLFQWYLNNYKVDPNWWVIYKLKWKEEKENDKDYHTAIQEMVDFITSGLTVALGCFCFNESKCHRALVKEDIMSKVHKEVPKPPDNKHRSFQATCMGPFGDGLLNVEAITTKQRGTMMCIELEPGPGLITKQQAMDFFGLVDPEPSMSRGGTDV